jgi:hypothetical protein
MEVPSVAQNVNRSPYNISKWWRYGKEDVKSARFKYMSICDLGLLLLAVSIRAVTL